LNTNKTKLLPVVDSWDDWAEIFTNTGIWKPVVSAICQKASIPMESMQGGYPGTNAVFIVNQLYVVKIYAPFCHDDFYLERELLGEIGKRRRIPIPRIITKGILEDRISWPYIIMSYMPGQPIREVRSLINSASSIDIAHRMGTIVYNLHQTPISSFKNLDHSRNGWIRYTHQIINSVSIKLQRKHILPQNLIRDIPSFVQSILAKYRGHPSEKLTLVHGDLTEDHWLLHNADGQWQISALIDFADAKISPAAYEWPALWFSGLASDTKSFHAFMESYNPTVALDDDFYQQAMAYTFLHEFGAEILEWVLSQHKTKQINSIECLIELLWMQDR
jgi:hygromycin-B 7''-O-kinase